LAAVAVPRQRFVLSPCYAAGAVLGCVRPASSVQAVVAVVAAVRVRLSQHHGLATPAAVLVPRQGAELYHKLKRLMQPLLSFGANILLATTPGLLIGFICGRFFLTRKYHGEALLANHLEGKFNRPHILINNVTLKTIGGTTQIDHVLVADTGIFVIENKHYGGWIFGDPQSRQWTQTIYRKKSRFQNPLHQNFGHVKALSALFNLPENHFHSVVVFTGDAEFKNDLGPNVVQLANFISFLSAERPVIFDERKMTYIVGRIEIKREKRSVETDEYHVNYVRRRVAHR
jgi:hypothetical protein